MATTQQQAARTNADHATNIAFASEVVGLVLGLIIGVLNVVEDPGNEANRKLAAGILGFVQAFVVGIFGIVSGYLKSEANQIRAALDAAYALEGPPQDPPGAQGNQGPNPPGAQGKQGPNQGPNQGPPPADEGGIQLN